MNMNCLLAACLVVGTAAAQNVSIPWEEFKSLYRDRVEEEVLMHMAQPPTRPQIATIDEVRYAIAVAGDEARGDVLISGRVLSGDPEPIPLFGPEVVLTSVENVAGGSLVNAAHADGSAFLPEAGAEFQLMLGFLAPVRDDGDVRTIAFDIPRALRNTLELTLPDGVRLVEHSGLKDANGLIHFASSANMALRYTVAGGPAGASVVDIDLFSHIRPEHNRITVETAFYAVRNVPQTISIVFPEESVLLATSVPSSHVRSLDANRYEVTVPGTTPIVTVEWAIGAFADDDSSSFPLPEVDGNSNRRHRFIVDEPEYGQLTVQAEGLVRQLPVERLDEPLRPLAASASHYMTLPSGGTLQLAVERLEVVAAPNIVLDAQYLFIAFEENGAALSTLILDIPSEAGRRLRIPAVPGAEIWSLTVNGENSSLYRDESGAWIVPLAPADVSHVELAYLREGPALGLHGTVEAAVPATGMPARDFRLALALPKRVNLLVVEGPVSAAPAESWAVPADFPPSRYTFSHSYYDGEGMTISASYKEPIDPAD